MRSITTRFDSPALRLAARILYYGAILGALWVVTSLVSRFGTGFVYQDF